jgi:hypothetical protein
LDVEVVDGPDVSVVTGVGMTVEMAPTVGTRLARLGLSSPDPHEARPQISTSSTTTEADTALAIR